MVKQSAAKKLMNADATQEMPMWASKLIERFDSYSACLQRSLTETLDRVLSLIGDLQRSQSSIISRLSDLESKISSATYPPNSQQNLLYSTLVKVRADSSRIDEKLRMITWVGIEEQIDEDTTRRFDREILREVIHTSGDENLVRAFEEGKISCHRFPSGKPRGMGTRGRIIKISLPDQALRDTLLAHMRTGRQSLTRNFVHSYARRDYTTEELRLDRALRKQAGDMNAREGSSAGASWVSRDQLEFLRSGEPEGVRFSNLSLACAPEQNVDDGMIEEDHSCSSESRSSTPTRPDIRRKLGSPSCTPRKRKRDEILERGFDRLEETSRFLRERWAGTDSDDLYRSFGEMIGKALRRMDPDKAQERMAEMASSVFRP